MRALCAFCVRIASYVRTDALDWSTTGASLLASSGDDFGSLSLSSPFSLPEEAYTTNGGDVCGVRRAMFLPGRTPVWNFTPGLAPNDVAMRNILAVFDAFEATYSKTNKYTW